MWRFPFHSQKRKKIAGHAHGMKTTPFHYTRKCVSLPLHPQLYRSVHHENFQLTFPLSFPFSLFFLLQNQILSTISWWKVFIAQLTHLLS
jgi:hypothetical protein